MTELNKIEPEAIARLLMTAMRGLASSVTVISAADRQGSRNAMTATSPTSLSMDPPAMLVCVSRTTSFHPLLAQGRDFCINILRREQQAIAQLCSSRAKGEDRFAEGNWSAGRSGTPYLTDAQAAIICQVDRLVPYGTHDIVIGNVLEVHLTEPSDPLIYAQGGYCHIPAPSTT